MTKHKLKIMETPPPLSEDEMLEFKDFDKLLADSQTFHRRQRRLTRMGLSALLVAAVALLSIVWWSERSLNTSPPAPEFPESKVVPESSSGEETNEPEPLKEYADETAHKKTTETRSAPGDDRPDTSSEPPSINDDEPLEINRPEATYVYVEAQPEIGFPALYEYFNREITYPAQALPDSVEGVVTVSFVIDVTGKPVDINIVNSLGSSFDSESRRLIQHMPQWKPATVNGKPVASKLSLPLTFEIVNPKKK